MNRHMIETDVLVVGHGISGLSAAISAKEDAPDLDILTVDKSFVGYAGKANKGGGHVSFVPKEASEQYIEYHTRNLGDYLNDQDMLRKYAENTRTVIDRWESWGVDFVAKEKPFDSHPIIPWKVMLVDGNVMLEMGKHARKIGVKSMEKITITDLLTDGDKVVGAFGMSLLTGETYVFKAKSVILANGNQDFSIMRMWASAKGDGIAAAYRAGAKIRNAEFGSFFNIMQIENNQVTYGSEDSLVNADGENPSTRGDLDESLRTVVGGVDLGSMDSILMYMSVRDGKGPVYENTAENKFPGSFPGRNLMFLGQADPPFARPYSQKFWDKIWHKNKAESYKDDNPLKEVIPGVVAEQSPLYVDHYMKTSLEGLFASGDICANGSSWSGAVPTPPGRNRGSGLIHGVFTGMIAAKSATDYAKDAEFGNISDDQIDSHENILKAPLTIEEGFDPKDIIWEIKNLIQPVEYTGYKNQERLQEALDYVLEQKEKLSQLKANDPHGLSAVNECKSHVLCAEMFFRASLERKESRGWHMREDFKERDDENYLKWIDLSNNNGEMTVSTEDIPIDSYKYKPEQKAVAK